jgi:hypothetical protein
MRLLVGAKFDLLSSVSRLPHLSCDVFFANDVRGISLFLYWCWSWLGTFKLLSLGEVVQAAKGGFASRKVAEK